MKLIVAIRRIFGRRRPLIVVHARCALRDAEAIEMTRAAASAGYRLLILEGELKILGVYP